MSQVPEVMREAVERARAEVCRLHTALVSNGLVAWTSGNVSARVPGADNRDLMVIKPSGIEYPELTPRSMVVCDLDGARVDGAYQPSSDTTSHAYVSGTCRRSAGSCTRIRRTPPRGRPAARRSPA